MLISRDPPFLFVHIQKTGGTSLEKVLLKSCPGASPLCGRHDHALAASRVLGEDFRRCFKFAFVRNPWERLVSWYSMIVQYSEGRPRHELDRLWQYALNTADSFEEFILRCTDVVEVDGVRKSFAFDQTSYIADEKGEIIVDFIGRHEHFERDALYVFRELGIPAASLPHVNESRHRDYRTYYTDETRAVVADRCRRDIERFGYQF